MKAFLFSAICFLALVEAVPSLHPISERALPSVSLPILASTENVDSDKVFFYYDSNKPQLIGNDGSADKGGFHVFNYKDTKPASLPEAWAQITGRTKVVSVVYGVQKKDYLVTFSTPEHTLRFFDLQRKKEVVSKFILAEFSALCGWKSPATGAQYIYLFGKKQVKVYVLQEIKEAFQVVEVTSFVLPIEAETCAIPSGDNVIMFAGPDKKLYSFTASDIPNTPALKVAAETEEEIAGSAVYHITKNDYIYLVAFEEFITVYSKNFEEIGTITIDGGEGFALSDIAILQDQTKPAPSGSLAYAYESDDKGKAFGISSLEPVFAAFNIKKNTKWTPESQTSRDNFPKCSALKDCSKGGICSSKSTCKCYVGFAGLDCSSITCLNDCSGNGKCIGANQCQCQPSWTGDDCSTLLVTAKYESEANGADGDDPAIWISATASQSRIITTTKSEDDPGLTVFDLKGKKLEFISAPEPNNVDVIYNFPISATKNIDLAYAGCRGDNTLCLFQITNGTLSSIPGGSQSLPDKFSVYGSCIFHRKRDGKVFLFANSKKAEYLQYELSSSNGTLTTTLVRQFKIGTGTQPEGCVVDDDNETLFLGEEQVGLWKYDANPDGSTVGTLVDSVNHLAGGKINIDVEGISLVYGKTSQEGYIIVSMQGVSNFNVYERAAPHKFVKTFSVGKNLEAGIDGVTNTDGVAAVSNNLGDAFEGGLIVMHDDANERPDGSTDAAASFKLVSLSDVVLL